MYQYIVIDLEMCKVDAKISDLGQEIIQIGAIALNEDLQICDNFMTYVSPTYGKIDRFIQKLTGISEKDTMNAPSINQALNLFIDWLPQEVILISWSDNDESQLRKEASIKNIDLSVLDEHIIDWEDCQITFAEKMNSNKNYKLSEALRIANIQLETGEHNALVDAKNTALLYAKMVKEEELVLSQYYMNAYETTRTTFTPFADLLSNYHFES